MKAAAWVAALVAILIPVAAVTSFIAGIWIDERWAMTGFVLLLASIPTAVGALFIVDEATK